MKRFIAARMSDGSDDPWVGRLISAIAMATVLVGVGILLAWLTHQWVVAILVPGTYWTAWFTREYTLPRRHRSYAREQERIRDSDLEFWLKPEGKKV
jgi:hypothetical protein